MGLVGRVLPGFVRFLANREAFSALVAPVLGRLKVDLLPEQGQLVFNTRETNFPGNPHSTLLLKATLVKVVSHHLKGLLEEISVAGNYLQLTDPPAKLGLPLLLGNGSCGNRKPTLDIPPTSTTSSIVRS